MKKRTDKSRSLAASDAVSSLPTQLPFNLKHLPRTRGLTILACLSIFLFASLAIAFTLPNSIVVRGGDSRSQPCDQVFAGYQCEPNISHSWGQYSPFFSAPSTISAEIPAQCQITFAQILSRHGARDPTASKTNLYNATIHELKSNVTSFSGKYAFLAGYKYTLGADQLTPFGEQQLINSGIKFYQRYQKLAYNSSIFVRSSSEARVVESAQNFTQGYHYAKSLDHSARPGTDYPYPIIVISEDDGSNNTLSHRICTAFENGTDSAIADTAKRTWLDIFAAPIRARLNSDLPGAHLSTTQTLHMMDLCPFNTVASPNGTISPFCSLFTQTEWKEYSYYESLDKYYGYGAGNPLGPTQGVGFTNELIARMTNTPVQDHTSTNHTLDLSNATFPIGPNHKLFADFSHDNDLTGIFFAMGLYNSTSPLSNTTAESEAHTNGYSAAWTVPFAARSYFEKMACQGEDDEWVRVVVNDRVVPLQGCGGDDKGLGRCELDKWIKSLSFAREGGLWRECFD